MNTRKSILPRKNNGPNLKTAIIGGGVISEQHLRTITTIPKVQVVGICDLSPVLSQFTANRFGIANWYTNYLKMLDECQADIVHVLTPPATHDKIVRDCIDSGHHVIVEKPVALSHAAFRELWEYAFSHNLQLIENHNYRFNEPVQQLERAVQAGEIGTVEEVEIRITVNIREGGRYADENLPHPSHKLPAGIIHEFITHLAYLVLRFMPTGTIDNIDIIRAAWRNHGGKDLFKYDDLDATIIAGRSHGRVRFSCHHWPDCFSIQLRGSDGIASAELFHPTCQITKRRSVGQHLTPLVNSLSGARTMAKSGFGSIWRKIQNKGAYEGLSQFLNLTYTGLLNDSELPVNYRDMDETSRLVDALLAEENRI